MSRIRQHIERAGRLEATTLKDDQISGMTECMKKSLAYLRQKRADKIDVERL